MPVSKANVAHILLPLLLLVIGVLLAFAIISTAIVEVHPRSISATTAPVYFDEWRSGYYSLSGYYSVNPFGWELTHVYTTAWAEFDDTGNSFDTNLSYTAHEAIIAGWCLTCYAKVTDYHRFVFPDTVGETTKWEMGSWNAVVKGINYVRIYNYGNYSAKADVYGEVMMPSGT